METFLELKNIPVKRINYVRKTAAPFFLYQLYRELLNIKPDAVHTHLRNADLYGQFAAFLCGIKKRIYTRHSSTFNHIYHKKSVIVDRLINHLATNIIAISEVTKKVLIEMEGVNEKKISLIHHGFDIDSFTQVSENRINHIRQKYAIPPGVKVIGVFARYTELKGYQYIIPAFGMLQKKYPDLHFVFANTTGEYKPIIKSLLNEHLPVESYTEIRFESDLQAFYQILDVYVHTPINNMIEAFGQTYVEALAAGIPSVFTLSGVANEFVVNEKNALVVDYKNSGQIYQSVERLLLDEPLRNQIIKNGREDVKQFKLEQFIEKSIKVYIN